MSNPVNTLTLVGRTTRDFVIKENSDGSKTLLGTLAVDANYQTREGESITDFIPFQTFINRTVKGIGSWANVGKGDQIAVSASVQLRPYQKNGETVYPEVSVVVEGYPQFLESRSVTTARRAEQVKAAAAPAAEAPTEADKDAEIAALRAQLGGNQKSYSTDKQFV